MAEEPEIKLPTSVGSSKKQESSRKTSPSALLTTPKPLYGSQKTGKFLKEMGIPDHLNCLLRNLYAVRKQQLELDMEQLDWFQIGKGVHQGCVLPPCLFNVYAEYIMRNTRLNEAQTRVNIAGRNISNLRYADNVTLKESKELKNLLMKVEK